MSDLTEWLGGIPEPGTSILAGRNLCRISPFTAGYDSWSRLGETYAERRERDRKAAHEAFYHSRVSAYPDAIERASWLAARPVRRAPPLLVAPRPRSRVGIRASGRRMTWRTKRRQSPSFPTNRQ